ncbi:MAG TPA: UDP-N-acetylmuramoyl-tripeptide--D-alanyl-D-alanine ligase [Chloroflexota bacterium]|nr:UDP-N-acetylmuramoyl-tripeptide--D-alanyl-D-alanine ligase [Chloroflexota bacterium]
MPLTLTDVLRGSGGELASGHEGEVTFERAVIDSREVQSGDLFVALKGEHVDGNDFVPHAIANHAAGIIANRPPGAMPNRVAYVQVPDTLKALQDVGAYKLRQVGPRVIGVTGTVGKTSTKETIAGALAQKHRVLRTERNLNTEIGVPLSLLRLEPEHDMAVLEMGMYVPGDIRFLAELTRPHIGVVTGVSFTHAERVGTIERIAEAKAELVDGLAKDGIAVLNGDNSWTRAMAERGKRSVLFGLEEHNDVRAVDVESRGLDGISLTLVHGGAQQRLDLKLIGKHSAYHALAAAAVMLSMDYSLAEAAKALAASPVESLRLRVLRGTGGFTLIDDSYNSSPLAARAALQLLSELPGGQHVAVLGDMRELGQYSADLHRQLGGHAASLSQLVVAVGEEAKLIAEGARQAGMPVEQVLATTDPQEAVDFLRPRLNAGDYLLIKGSRAMGLETIVKEFAE